MVFCFNVDVAEYRKPKLRSVRTPVLEKSC